MSNTKESSNKELVEQYFEKNKSEKVIYATSDNFLFQQYKHALDHANTLEESKREVETFKNPLHLDVTVKTSDAIELTIEQKKLLESGLVKENYNDLKALVKVLKIETSDQKAETLIKALEDYKISNK